MPPSTKLVGLLLVFGALSGCFYRSPARNAEVATFVALVAIGGLADAVESAEARRHQRQVDREPARAETSFDPQDYEWFDEFAASLPPVPEPPPETPCDPDGAVCEESVRE